jgi:hypothetical protein
LRRELRKHRHPLSSDLALHWTGIPDLTTCLAAFRPHRTGRCDFSSRLHKFSSSRRASAVRRVGRSASARIPQLSRPCTFACRGILCSPSKVRAGSWPPCTVCHDDTSVCCDRSRFHDVDPLGPAGLHGSSRALHAYNTNTNVARVHIRCHLQLRPPDQLKLSCERSSRAEPTDSSEFDANEPTKGHMVWRPLQTTPPASTARWLHRLMRGVCTLDSAVSLSHAYSTDGKSCRRRRRVY